MTNPVSTSGLTVARCLFDFITDEALPGTGLEAEEFWAGLAAMTADLAPRNRALLTERDRLQTLVDGWHRAHPGRPDLPRYREFLSSIGYLVPEPEPFTITTGAVDPELSSIAGPQLVVPVLNPRFALNAANARWGSLYDALYGTDAIPGPAGGEHPGRYDPDRGRQVIAHARRFLDQTFPLTTGRHDQATRYRATPAGLLVDLVDGASAGLQQPEQFRGHTGEPDEPRSILLRHHGLHVDVQIDRDDPVGSTDPAGVKDLVIEAALTTIVDFEDSVAAVDAEDKVSAYRSWLELNRGDLTAEVTRNGSTTTRRLAADRTYTAADGGTLVLPGRAVLMVRNVGHLMTTDAVLDSSGREIPEGILDAVVTSLAALPGLDPANPFRSNRSGSVYIVKPKMHGPDEVSFAGDLFSATERLLRLAPGTLKMGVMDEERRTSVNLRAVIQAAADRIVFVNTGFLDRTGDEIHTAMEAGPMVRKADMKDQRWISAYEDANVGAALAAGFRGRAQIGKGMWAMPDLMADMLDQKGAQPRAGASTAWVPSPTAATLHALHYHEVDVASRQREIAAQPRSDLDALLTVPVAEASWTAEERQEELDNNIQSILGYVVRWIDQGIGCSKVPDLHDVALMEDRATLRISSQLLVNWLRHDVVSAEQVEESLLRMAAFVDQQNRDDQGYRPMTLDPGSSTALRAASDLIFGGAASPNGYTEPVLHRRRRERKAELAREC